jgi:hypothetical protein
MGNTLTQPSQLLPTTLTQQKQIPTQMPSSSTNLPKGPSSFSTFQLPGTSNHISVNLAGLQECMMTSSGSDLLNNCISGNIKGLSNQSNSYQNIKYVGPGHNINNKGQVTFGALQNFQNLENIDNNDYVLVCYFVIIIIYLFVMLRK